VNDQKSPQPPARFAFLKLTPKTGRTHQLRVHLMAIGHPMLGDTMYGGRILQSDAIRLERQALHAASISFIHPTTLEPMTLSAPLPPDLKTVLELLRNGTDPLAFPTASEG
jgi:23S rRNA pseudouridine1911/1915/1917 synthase